MPEHRQAQQAALVLHGQAEFADLEAMLEDKSVDREMRDLAELEYPDVKERIEGLEQEIQILLLPKDAADEKSAILEIRAGTGGSEAALFAGDLFRMYERFAAANNWKVEVLSSSDGEAGGWKELTWQKNPRRRNRSRHSRMMRRSGKIFRRQNSNPWWKGSNRLQK